MKKSAIILSIFCGTLFINSYADVQMKNDPVRAMMQKQGFTLDKGVTLLPSEKIIVPNRINTLWGEGPPAKNNLNSLWLSEQPSQKENNIQEMYSDRAEELLQLDEAFHENYKYNANNTDLNSPVLRKSISDIHMAYTFIPVSDMDASKHYGFSACGTFNYGWTGVVELFQKSGLGNCAFTEYNFTLAHATAIVKQTIVRDDVNHKTTTIHVEGNKDSGYVYSVAWMDEQFFRTLECASNDYSADKTSNVVALAQRIDTQKA